METLTDMLIARIGDDELTDLHTKFKLEQDARRQIAVGERLLKFHSSPESSILLKTFLPSDSPVCGHPHCGSFSLFEHRDLICTYCEKKYTEYGDQDELFKSFVDRHRCPDHIKDRVCTTCWRKIEAKKLEESRLQKKMEKKMSKLVIQ